jgi:hypothetical protein
MIKGYWPLNTALSSIWSAYDNSINYITSFHMLLASLATIRSLQNPRGFERELLLRHPVTVILIIWLVCLLPWVIIILIFGDIPYTLIVYNTNIVLITALNLIWLALLILILAASIWIYVFLYNNERKKSKKKIVKRSQSMSTQNNQIIEEAHINVFFIEQMTRFKKRFNEFRVSTQTKFLIIMGSYLLQWAPPCLMIFISPFVYINPSIYTAVYWYKN